MKLKHKKIYKQAVAAGILAAVILVLSLLKHIPAVAESVFARGVSRAYIAFAGSFSSLFAFSLFELLVVAAVVSILITIVKAVKALRCKKYDRALKSVMTAVVVALSAVTVYTASASFYYYRAPIETVIPQSVEKPEKEELLALVNAMMDDFNHLAETLPRDSSGAVISPSFKEMNARMKKEFERLDELDAGYFNPYTPRVKKILFSGVLIRFNTMGITFLPTGEPNVDSCTPNIYMPYLMAHEMAHAKGVMIENGAELVAAYITLTSEDPYIRYSGLANYFSYASAMLALNEMEEEYLAVYARRSPLIRQELNLAYEYYSSMHNIFTDIGRFFNDIYLKMSGSKEGIDSYDDDFGVIDVPVPQDDGTVIYVPEVFYNNIQKMILSLYLL